MSPPLPLLSKEFAEFVEHQRDRFRVSPDLPLIGDACAHILGAKFSDLRHSPGHRSTRTEITNKVLLTGTAYQLTPRTLVEIADWLNAPGHSLVSYWRDCFIRCIPDKERMEWVEEVADLMCVVIRQEQAENEFVRSTTCLKTTTRSTRS